MCDFLTNVDPLSGSFATLVRLPKRLLTFDQSLSRNLGQISDSNQVISGGCELEDPTHQRQPTVASLMTVPLSSASQRFSSARSTVRPAYDSCNWTVCNKAGVQTRNGFLVLGSARKYFSHQLKLTRSPKRKLCDLVVTG